MNAKPSFWRIIFTDNASLILGVLTIAFGITIVGIPVALLSLFLLFKRAGGIRKTFATGVAVQATIVRKRYSSGFWKVAYRYKYGDGYYESRNNIVRFRLGIKRRDTLEAYLLPQKPETAFLAKFYCKTPSQT